MSDEAGLDHWFSKYRDACPDPEPSSDFMPGLWRKIEARQSFWFVFQRFARTTTAACAAACVLLLVLNFVTSKQATHLSSPNYVDALLAEHTAEQTDYTEAIRTSPSDAQAPPVYHH